MSDDRWMSMPSGRKLEQPDYGPDYQGSIGVLRRPDKASLRLARRNMREIPEAEIEGQGLHLVERTTGETWKVVTSHVDLADPRSSGAEAFVVRGGWFVPLRSPDWRSEGDKTVAAGEIYGREAEPKDSMPMPTTGVVVHPEQQKAWQREELGEQIDRLLEAYRVQPKCRTR